MIIFILILIIKLLGSYCGPGPDESVWSTLKPVDEVDSLCFKHDMAYRQCLEDLSVDIGFKAPKLLHQLMPIRGFLPSPIRMAFNKLRPNYVECMHMADKDMINGFDTIAENQRLPMWWSDTSLAPFHSFNVEGTQGYAEACVIGLGEWTGTCLLSTKNLFSIMVGVFSTSINSDAIQSINSSPSMQLAFFGY